MKTPKKIKNNYFSVFFGFVLPSLLVFIPVVIVLGAVAYLERGHADSHQQTVRAEVLNRASILRARMEGLISDSLLMARAMEAYVAVNPEMTQAQFDRFAARLFGSRGPHVVNIALAEGTVVRHVYPLARNEAVLGLDYREVAYQFEAIEQAIENRRIVVAGPLPLVQGGTAFITRLPIFLDRHAGGRYWGLVSVPMDVERLFEAAGLFEAERDMVIALRGADGLGAEGDVYYGPPGIFDDDPVLMDVHLPQGLWQLAVAPRDGWPRTGPNTTLIRSAGVLLAALLALLGLGLTRYLSSRRQAEDALRAGSERLKLILNSSLMPLYITRIRDGAVLFCNARAAEMAGLRLEETDRDVPAQHWVDQDERRQYFETLLREGRVTNYRARLRGADGKEFWALMSSLRLDYDGEDSVLTVLSDFTDEMKAEQYLQKLAVTDPLTGVYNRRYFTEALELDVSRARRHKRPLSLLMLDLDNFKTINDTYGHGIGDDVLKAFAKTCAECLRQGDVLARMGGEEFAVLLPEAELEGARTMAERLRQRVEGMRVDGPEGPIRVTVSIGLTCHDPTARKDGVTAALHRADQALYMAKAKGRNRVVAAEDMDLDGRAARNPGT